MIHATRARTKSNEVLEKTESEILKVVEGAIDLAITKGEFECTVYQSIPDSIQNQLTRLGYTLSNYPDRDHSAQWTISW